MVKVRFESLDGARSRRRARVRPAALQRRHRRRRLDARARAARARQPDRQRARRATRAHAHELGLHGPHGRPPGAHLRRAAARQRRPAGPHPPDRSRPAPGPGARRSASPRSAPTALRRRRRLARRRVRRRSPPTTRPGGSQYRNQLKPIPAAAVPVTERVRDLAARPQGPRGQGQPGRVRRLAEHAVGLGRAADRPRQPALGAVSPRLGARPLPDRHGAAGGGGQGLGGQRARLPLRRAAARRRLVPAELPGRRHAEVEGRADGPGRAADRARLAARAHRRARLAPHPQGRRLHRRPRADLRAGALGEPGGLLAGDDRGRDRRARLRRGDRARQRGRRAASTTYLKQGRLLGRQRPAVDGDHQRAVQRRSVLPAADQGQGPRHRHEVRDRRLRALRASTSAASSTRASSSSSGSASSAPTIR